MVKVKAKANLKTSKILHFENTHTDVATTTKAAHTWFLKPAWPVHRVRETGRLKSCIGVKQMYDFFLDYDGNYNPRPSDSLLPVRELEYMAGQDP